MDRHDPDQLDVDDRMRRFAKCDGSPQSIQAILLDGLSEREQDALALGVRVGKHSAAVVIVRELHSKIGDELAAKIDPYMDQSLDVVPILPCKTQLVIGSAVCCGTDGELCRSMTRDGCPDIQVPSNGTCWHRSGIDSYK